MSRVDSLIAGVALVVSIVVLALGVVLAPIVVTRIPADYFMRTRARHSMPPAGSGPLRMALFWLRNAAGAVLVLAGVAMLVLPGQGVLTILAGLSLLTFPGKRELELRILRVRAVRHPIDKLRKRAGKPPLQLDDTNPHQSSGL